MGLWSQQSTADCIGLKGAQRTACQASSAQAPQVRAVGGNKAGIASLAFLQRRADALGECGRFAALRLSSAYSPDSGVAYPRCISIAFLDFLTVEGREECQAAGPCELYTSDTLFCVHKERNLGDNFCGLSLRDTDCCL